MSRSSDQVATFLQSGVGPQTVVVPSGQQGVVLAVGCTSVTGGQVTVALSGSRTFALGPVPAGGRLNLIIPDEIAYGDSDYDLVLTVPADGIAYIGGYLRHG